MFTIQKLQQRDLLALEALQPEKDFEADYLAHLQEQQHVLVANHKDEDGLRHYFGYVSILWGSTYTPFWQHNIPQIVDLYVAETHRRRGIGTALVSAIESAAQENGYRKIGVCLEPVGKFTAAKALYQKLEYINTDFVSEEENRHLCLVKNL